jgi:hypothetical protein
MKKLLLILCLMPVLAFAGINLGIKKQDEYISYAIFCVDSNGVDRAPDSAQVITYLDQNGLATAFTTRSTTYPFPIGIDTSKIYADTTYYFSDQIQDIDGTPSPSTVYTLAIDVILWTKAIATHNPAVVQVIPDSLDNYLADASASLDSLQLLDEKYTALRDSINLVHVENQNLDGWNPITDNDSLIIDKSAQGFITTGDSVIVDGSALAATANAITATTIANDAVGSNELATTAADEAGLATWNTSALTAFTAGSMGDSAIGAGSPWSGTAAGGDASPSAWDATDTAVARAVVWEALLATYDNVAGSFGDSAGGWGATAAGSSDTANIGLWIAHHPDLVSGRQVGYWGVVAGTTPGDFGFVVSGANIDLTKVNDYYNGWDLRFYSGGWKNQEISVTDWITASDSIEIDTLPSAVRSASTPAIGDSFTISPAPIIDLYEWSGRVINDAELLNQQYTIQVNTIALSGDDVAADNAERLLDGTGYNMINSRLEFVDTVVTLRANERTAIAARVADTGQLLNWDGTPLASADSAQFSRMMHRIAHGTQVDANSDTSTLAERDVTTADLTTPAVDEIAEQVNDSVWLANFGDYDNTLGTFGDSAQTWGATGAGGGGDCIEGATITWTVYAVDSTGTPTAVPGVSIYLKDGSNNTIALGITNATGYTTFTVTDGTWNISGMGAVTGSYIWVARNKTVSVNQTDTLKGYNFSPSAPPSATTATVYGFLGDFKGNVLDNATVTFSLPGHVTDTCTGISLVRIVESTTTNSLGYYEMVLIKSSCFSDSVTYEVTAKKRILGTEYQIKKSYQLYIPSDSTTYFIQNW